MRKSLYILVPLFVCSALVGQNTGLLADTISICQGDSAFVEIRQHVDNHAAVSWSTPFGIITNTKKVQATLGGKYYVRVVQGQSISTDSCFVRFSSRVRPLLRDTSLCKGRSLQLDARHAGLKYQWNTGETTQRIVIDAPGRYWVKIRNGACVTIDTVQVKQTGAANVSLPSEVTFCMNDEHKVISARAAPGSRFLWNTGATTASVQVTKEGTYWVKTNYSNCGTETDSIRVKLKLCECEMIIPNSFTPNEDNRNDHFFPVVQCDYSYFSMTITDRWGNTVYASTNVNGKWDGRFKGNLCPEDIYIYKIESTEKGSEKKQVRNGRISLFR